MTVESEAIALLLAEQALMADLAPGKVREILATTHREMVAQLVKPGADVLADLTPDAAHLLHMAVGLPGEVGELIDALKRFAIYQRPLDVANVIEELGDIEFYLEGIRARVGVSRDLTLTANKVKLLGKRYAAGTYSNAAALARADKPAGE